MTAGARLLPGPTSKLWDDPRTVMAIAGVDQAAVDWWLRNVDPDADHTLIHGVPQHGCPGCPPAEDPGDRSAEVHWWKRAVA